MIATDDDDGLRTYNAQIRRRARVGHEDVVLESGILGEFRCTTIAFK